MLDGLKFSLQRTPKKMPKSIPQISKKKQERIKEHGSESDLFKTVWAERKHECENCGKELFTPRAHNFDHEKPKSRGESYRLDPDNIQILCFGCHFYKTNKLIYKGIDLDTP